MTPTREQFKEFIAAVQTAQQKEDKLNQTFTFVHKKLLKKHLIFKKKIIGIFGKSCIFTNLNQTTIDGFNNLEIKNFRY